MGAAQVAQSEKGPSFAVRHSRGACRSKGLLVDQHPPDRFGELAGISTLAIAEPRRRRHEHPSGVWVTQQAREVCADVVARGDQPPGFLIHDRDSKFSRGFDEVFRSDGTIVIRTPIQAPNANACAARWVRTVRNDCLDRILILGRRQLEQVLRVYVTH
jgi:hypothetical protein